MRTELLHISRRTRQVVSVLWNIAPSRWMLIQQGCVDDVGDLITSCNVLCLPMHTICQSAQTDSSESVKAGAIFLPRRWISLFVSIVQQSHLVPIFIAPRMASVGRRMIMHRRAAKLKSTRFVCVIASSPITCLHSHMHRRRRHQNRFK